MAGKIKQMMDKIIEKKTQGNPTLVMTTKTKFILKGLNPDQFTATSPDDPEVITKLRQIASEMGIVI
ncbi:hypothetical protein JCM14469_28640 [Desulfatiferula olefinivorans]